LNRFNQNSWKKNRGNYSHWPHLASPFRPGLAAHERNRGWGSSIGCGRRWHWLFSSLAARGGGSTGRGACLWGGAPIFGVNAEGISPKQVRELGKRSVAPVARFTSTRAPRWSSGTCRRHQTVVITGYPREGPCQRWHSGEPALEALHSGCWH
jgi:hypothetical protein